MSEKFDFNDLFVLDMANNHQGSVEHGQRIIEAMADVAARHDARVALKFQFRQLDTFIHPSHHADSEHGYVKRFLGTRLEREHFEPMLETVRARGLLSMVTPFDEESVHVALDMGFELLKVASCSAKDWPLLEEIARAGRPVVASTGALETREIDELVLFFEERDVDFAIMHCVPLYPTPNDRLHLNRIDDLRERHPGVPIGWSTHEDPDDVVPVQIAVAKGAQLFERHVGLPTDEITLNAYSSTPAQVDAWLAAHARARVLCGPLERPPVPAPEKAAIDGLRRGVFAQRPIRRGEVLTRDDVYFAMPYEEGQLESGAWRDGVVASGEFSKDGPLGADQVEQPQDEAQRQLRDAMHDVRALLNKARIVLGPDDSIEVSHHAGIENFRKTGAVLIECMNREYCKKLLVQLPGQWHPSHRHAKKEETFVVLYGVLDSVREGEKITLHPGDQLLIEPGQWHSFSTPTGAVVEEVSTMHYNDDSFYEDETINNMSRAERKTRVAGWRRVPVSNGGASSVARTEQNNLVG